MIKAIIVEDEFPGQEFLRKKINEHFLDIEIVAVEESVAGAVTAINKHKPDLVFLDIEIINGTGFNVLEQVENKTFEVIFTTAYSQYAIKAIKAQVFDYILKPINITELKESVSKVVEKIQQEKNNTLLDKLAVPTLKGIDYVGLNEVLYFEADGAYTYIAKHDAKILSSKNIGEFEKIINADVFHRCHHSFIVNSTKIKTFIKQRSGVLVMDNGDSIPVAQRRMKYLTDLLKI